MDLDQMVTDLTSALDDVNKKSGAACNLGRKPNGGNRAAAWAHRRSRSTSHLNIPTHPAPAQGAAGHKSESEDTSKGGNDSDEAERSLAKLSLQNSSQRTLHASKSIKHSRTCSMPLTRQCIVESDSVNELFSPTHPSHQLQAPHSKRPRRRHKRMAVEVSDPSGKDVMMPCSSRTAAMGAPFLKTAPLLIYGKVASRKHSNPPWNGTAGSGSAPKKNTQPLGQDMRVDFCGKRKRGYRDKQMSNSAPEASGLQFDDQGLSAMDLVNLGMDALNGSAADGNDDEVMKSETSSLSSLSDSECEHHSCDEGQDGDDEHSDWVGDEWIDETDDSERRRDLIMRRLLHCSDSREIRAGKRKGYPNKPVFSIKTSANEELSKFLQNSEQSELKLHPMHQEERVQLSQLASLYSLQMHCLNEGDPSGLPSPVLTKTSNTTKMDNSVEEKNPVLCPVLSESDTKRIKM